MSPAEKKATIDSTDNIYAYVQACLHKSSGEALEKVGIRGGNMQPLQYIDCGFANVSIVDHLDQERFEHEVESYIESNIQSCLSFEGFEHLQPTAGNPTAHVSIEKDVTHIELDMHVEADNGGKSRSYTSFSDTQWVRLESMIDTANGILASCIAPDEILDSNLRIYHISFDKDVTVIEDNANLLRGQPYRIAFASNRSISPDIS